MFLPLHIQETPLLEQNNQNLAEHHIFLKTKLDAIRTYYYQAYLKASTPEKKKEIAKEYEHCNHLVKHTLSGQMSAEEAKKQLPKNPAHDKALVITYNLLKACEVLYHTAIASIAYTIGMVLGAPLLFLGAPSGFAISIIAGIIFAASIYCATVCFTEFKSFDKKHEVRTHLKDIFSFFSDNPRPEVSQESTEPRPLGSGIV